MRTSGRLLRADCGAPMLGRSPNPLEYRGMGSEPDITDLLLAWRAGDRGAMDRVFPLVYEELRRIAHHQLERERPDHTLGTTAVVRSEEHTSELQSHSDLVCRLLLEKKKIKHTRRERRQSRDDERRRAHYRPRIE